MQLQHTSSRTPQQNPASTLVAPFWPPLHSQSSPLLLVHLSTIYTSLPRVYVTIDFKQSSPLLQAHPSGTTVSKEADMLQQRPKQIALEQQRSIPTPQFQVRCIADLFVAVTEGLNCTCCQSSCNSASAASLYSFLYDHHSYKTSACIATNIDIQVTIMSTCKLYVSKYRTASRWNSWTSG